MLLASSGLSGSPIRAGTIIPTEVEPQKELDNKAPKLSDKDLERMVGQAVAAAFSGNPETRSVWYRGEEVNDTRAALKEQVDRVARREISALGETIIQKANTYIASEEFIDTLVERIKRKQL